MPTLVQVKLTDNRLPKLLQKLKPAWRETLHRQATYALKTLVEAWIRKEEPKHHKWAKMLGATPTYHLQEIPITSEADADGGRVIISSAGFNRVFHPLLITPKKARALTIPISAWSYGMSAREMSANGWSIFHPPKTDVLMGVGPAGDGPVSLYKLAKSAKIKQDRTLLPTDKDMSDACTRAMLAEIKKVFR